MGKVVLFPVSKRLPKGLEDEVYKIAKEYVEVLYVALTLLSSDDYTPEEFEEIHKLVAIAYAEGIDKAIYELEES